MSTPQRTSPPSPKPKHTSSRAIQIGLRSIHLATMGLVLGGVAFGVAPERLKWPLILTAASGLLLLAAAVRARCLVLSEGAGWGLFLKLALLGLGNAIPAVRIELFIAATLVASVASHMPSAWRHRAPPWR